MVNKVNKEEEISAPLSLAFYAFHVSTLPAQCLPFRCKKQSNDPISIQQSPPFIYNCWKTTERERNPMALLSCKVIQTFLFSKVSPNEKKNSRNSINCLSLLLSCTLSYSKSPPESSFYQRNIFPVPCS